MGILKLFGSFVTGGLLRPTTTRERSRMYQRRANRLLELQLDAMQNLGQQQGTHVPTDTRPRGTCPACMELMLVGASTCPHCHTTGISWPSAPAPTPHSHSHSIQTSSSTITKYIPNNARKTKSSFVLKNEASFVLKNEERQREADRAAGPEVLKLREEISKVARRRDKMRQKLKGDTNAFTCTACNEKLPAIHSDCFNCQYKALRKRIDDLTKPT